MSSRIGTIELPPVIHKPGKFRGYPKSGLKDEGKQRCPYCLETLAQVEAEPSLPRACPICQHSIPITILGTVLHCFNRAQKWDLLANEMEYIWNAEHLDVDSYIESMGSYYNPDYGEVKERLFGMLAEKESLLRLKEEFLEAEGELDLLMIGYLNKLDQWRGDMGRRLFAGRQWRLKALELSLLGAGLRPIAEFQLYYIKSLHWAVFGNVERRERAILFLEDRLGKMSEEPLGGEQTG